MRVLAALFAGLFFYLLVAYLTGNGPKFEVRRSSPTQVSPRQLWLIQAGSDLTPRQFRAGSIAAAAITFVLFLFLTGAWWIALVPAVVVGLWPRAYSSRRRNQRLAELRRAWPDGIRDILAYVKSGASLPGALEALARKGPEPLRLAFERFPLQARMFGMIPALEMVKEELADPTSDKVIEVLILAHQHGGDLVEDVLRDLIDTTVADLATQEGIRTANFEQRLESWVVVAAPWMLLLFLATIPDSYVAFYRSPPGRFTVLVGAVWAGIGWLLMRRIARQHEEPRVLGGGSTVGASSPSTRRRRGVSSAQKAPATPVVLEVQETP
jgi:tight adherence protein B